MPFVLARLTRRLNRSASVFLLAATLITPHFIAQDAFARSAKGPDVVADLAEQVSPAVVNISTTQRIEPSRSVPVPQLPEGAPFQEFFNEFFKNQGPEQQQRRGSSLGSGFVIEASGYIVTNNHVIDKADEITANFADGRKLTAKLVGRDAKTDIALLKVESDTPLTAVKFGDSDSTRVGEWVMAVGNPFGFGGSVTVGIVSAKNRDIHSGPYDSFLQTDAAINRGNSGGPLFNMNGEVVGINTAIVSPSGGSIGIGFSIPSSMAQMVVEQLKQYGEARRGYLGVQIQAVTDDLAENLGLGKKGRGALVANITPDSPATKAGLQRGDVIVRFNDRDIVQMRDLPRVVADTPIDREVPVVIVRNGKEETHKVMVGRLKEDTQTAENKPIKPENLATGKPVLGMIMVPLSPDLRRQLRINDDVKGAVVMKIVPGSIAAEKQVSAGEVIVEVAQQPVASPQEVVAQIDEMKKKGRKSALFLLANRQGEMRFVTLPLD